MADGAAVRRRALDRHARALSREWRRLLRDQLARYQRRLADTLPAERSVHRMLTAGDLERILAGPEEVARLMEEFGREVLEAAIREAMRRELAALGRAALFDALQVLQAADLQLGRMVVEVSDFTRERVGVVVSEGIERGASINDIQKALQTDQGFSPMRALRIGRTEAARAQTEGQLAAYRQAVADGADFEVEWSSAGFGERPEHRALDGQRVAPGGLFVVPIGADVEPRYVGATAPGPALFTQPGLSINCRCTLVPRERRPPE